MKQADPDTHPTAGGAHEAADGPVVLDRYRLARRLGSGGFGTVWLAHDETLDRMVAVKRIGIGDPAVAKRAEREAKAAARLSHPGIVALYEAGRDDDAVYLVSELVRGRTLGRLMEDGALSDLDVCRIGSALCDALVHAHQRGVVHRDVKPGNVIIPEAPEHGAGIAKLTDFGIARLHGDDALTQTGDIVGTLAYMAPEQAEGREAKAPADLYALALVLYEALSGVNPVRGRTPASTARRVGVRLPPLERLRRDLPLELCRAIDRAVAPRPADRGTLRELRTALRDAEGEVDDEPGTVEAGALEAVTRVTRMVAAVRPARTARLEDVEDEPWARDDDRPARRDPWTGVRVPEGEAVPRPRATPAGRTGAALGAGALAAAAFGWLGPPPPVPALGAGVLAAALVALLPRLGWLALATAVVVWLLADPEGTNTAGGGGLAAGSGGLALVVLLAALPALGLLWRGGGTWLSAPGLAPLLGLATLAGAFPALAGQARGVATRAALGALGVWWLLLAEVLTGRTLLLGPPPDVAPHAAWAGSARQAAEHAVGPVLAGGALGIAVLWALAAALLPLVVRGRAAAVDLVAATMWAAGLAAGTQAIARALGWAPEPRGLVAGAIAGGVAAVAARAWRGAA